MLAWIHGGGTFHANIIPQWEDHLWGDIFRIRRPALASPRRRHRRAINTVAERSSNGARPTTVPRQRTLCPQTDPQTDAFSAY